MITSTQPMTRVLRRQIAGRHGKITSRTRPWSINGGIRHACRAGFTVLMGLIFLSSQPARAQNSSHASAGRHVHAGERIDISHSRPLTIHRASRGSATQHRIATAPQQHVVGAADTVDGYEISNGSLVHAPTTVYETAEAGGYYEPACGCETVCDCPGGYRDPACGLETWIEPGCGCEGIGCDSCCDGTNPGCGCAACRRSIGGFIDGIFPRLGIEWEKMDLFAGVTSFTGPMNFADVNPNAANRVGTGSYGFYEGFNKGNSLRAFGTDASYQFGARFTQSNISGSGFTDERRDQAFVTGGFFRRVDYGLQYGLVLDYLNEDWYYRGEMLQVRGELGWVTRRHDTVGLQFTAAIDEHSAITSVQDENGATVQKQILFRPLSQYRLFYRKNVARCGSCEGFAGWTESNDALLGMNVDLPVSGRWMWNTSATYLIPKQGVSTGGNYEEGWNLGIGFTYRTGGFRRGARYNRPLLPVADNGTLMMHLK